MLERRGHVPERQALSDPAELEAHDADEVPDQRGAVAPPDVHARAQHRPLLAPEEGQAHAEMPRRRGREPGGERMEDPDGRRVVVGARAARYGVVM